MCQLLVVDCLPRCLLALLLACVAGSAHFALFAHCTLLTLLAVLALLAKVLDQLSRLSTQRKDRYPIIRVCHHSIREHHQYCHLVTETTVTGTIVIGTTVTRNYCDRNHLDRNHLDRNHLDRNHRDRSPLPSVIILIMLHHQCSSLMLVLVAHAPSCSRSLLMLMPTHGYCNHHKLVVVGRDVRSPDRPSSHLTIHSSNHHF